MSIALMATDNAVQRDTRRIGETDSDFQRLYAATRRDLAASVRRFVRDLRAARTDGEESAAQSAFIARHTTLMRSAYHGAYVDGQRDFYGAVSRKPNKYAQQPDPQRTRRALAFYAAPSIAKMAHEAVMAKRSMPPAKQLDDNVRFTYDDALQQWVFGTDVRVDMQANLAWSGLQQGYYDGPLTDPANPYYMLYWDLEPSANHCPTCPDYADGSPYTPPGSGVNELDATPGDGHTECGAACKCSLRYGSGSAADVGRLTWNQAWKFWTANPDQRNVPPFLAAIKQGMPAPLVLPSRDDLTVDQEIALDDYRDANIRWDMVRGDLPPLPGLFSESDWTPPQWDTLTQAQQDALTEAVMAMVDWGTASDAEIQAAFEQINFEQALNQMDWEGM